MSARPNTPPGVAGAPTPGSRDGQGGATAKKINRRAKLTVAYIRAAVSADPRLDPVIDLDEYGKAIVYTREGWTWCALDGNRTVEGFLISRDNCDGDPQDTVGYFEDCRRKIEVAK